MWRFFPFKQIADSWSAYVKSPIKTTNSSNDRITPNTVEEPAIIQSSELTNATQPSLLSSLTSSLGGWVFNQDDNSLVQVIQCYC